MTHRRNARWTAILLSLAAAAGGLLPSAVGAAPAPPANDPVRGVLYDGLTRGATDGPCKGAFEITDGAGRVSCTHGPDPAPAGVDVRQRQEPGAAQSRFPTAPPPVQCYGTGSDGYRVQVIYARASDVPDTFALFEPLLRLAIAGVDDVVNYSAAETGGSQHVRYVTDASCQAVITKVTLTPSGDDTLSNTITELHNQGFTATNRKYLVFVDANVYCGIAEWYQDDSASATPGSNANNGKAGVSGMVSRVDNGCWGKSESAEAHELMHTLGGVQATAPHATFPQSMFAHCTDEYDRMCYDDDGAGPVTTSVVCPAAGHENRYDCNHDDYYNTNPAGGSYLATHWNAANSAFLSPIGSPGTAPPNDNFAAAQAITGVKGVASGTNLAATKEASEPNHAGNAGGASVWFRWTAPATYRVRFDTLYSDFDTLLGVYAGTSVDTLTPVATNDDYVSSVGRSKVVFNATAGTTYQIAVDGKATVGKVVLRWDTISATPDFNGDGVTELAVYRPSDSTWWIRNGSPASLQWGTSGDIPVPADYDGDGKTDVAVFRPSNGTWWLKNSGTPTAVVQWGVSGDIPVPADYDGDGRADLAVFRPSTGTWWVKGSTAPAAAFQWGVSGDVPVPGDYDGDGKADAAVYRPSQGIWYVNGGVPPFVSWGAGSDIPVPSNRFGWGSVNPTVFRPSNGVWYTAYNSVFAPNGGITQQWGVSGDVPVPADYGGGGFSYEAVFRPSNQVWYIAGSATAWGATGDVPLSIPYAIYKMFFGGP